MSGRYLDVCYLPLKMLSTTTSITEHLTINRMHECFRIARSDSGAERRRFLNATQLIVAQFNLDRLRVLFEPFTPFCSRNRHDVFALREQPCESQLRWRAILLRGDFFGLFNKSQIAFKILALKSWQVMTKIIGCKILRFLKRAG